MTQILMPKATAVWLVDNTSLTFEQIADFCVLHPLEVKGIADGEVARDIRGADPIANGQLSRDELDVAEKDAGYRMKAQKSRHAELLKPVKKAPRYTPVSRRQDRPDAIAWFITITPKWRTASCHGFWGPQRPPSIRCATARTGIRPISSRWIPSPWVCRRSLSWTPWFARPPTSAPRKPPVAARSNLKAQRCFRRQRPVPHTTNRTEIARLARRQARQQSSVQIAAQGFDLFLQPEFLSLELP